MNSRHQSYTLSVRRIPASLLLLLISFSLISPLLAAPVESKLPVCCRRDGKHRCAAMPGKAPHSSGLRIATAPCSQFPRAKATVAAASGFVIVADTTLFTLSTAQVEPLPEGILQQPELGNDHQERGPPCISR
jgi:hypothetical protein